MGNQAYFQKKTAQTLKELIKINMYFYSLFLPQQINIVSLKNFHPPVIILTLDLHSVLHISEQTSFSAMNTIEEGITGCSNKKVTHNILP